MGAKKQQSVQATESCSIATKVEADTAHSGKSRSQRLRCREIWEDGGWRMEDRGWRIEDREKSEWVRLRLCTVFLVEGEG
jgi:hypothetical protein